MSVASSSRASSARDLKQIGVLLQPGDAERLHARLPRSEKVAFTTQAQVLFRDAEAIVALAHDGEAGLGRFAERRLVEEDAGRGLLAAADPPAQLVKLRQAEAFGMLDDDDRGIGNVDADLDHGGGDDDPRRARLEVGHHAVLLLGVHPSMNEADPVAEELAQHLGALFGRRQFALVAFLDQRADPVELVAFLDRLAGTRDDVVEPLERNGDRGDRLAAGRLPVKARDVHVAEGGEHEGARDGGGGHDEKVGRAALARQAEALVDAEAMLLVHHHQPRSW